MVGGVTRGGSVADFSEWTAACVPLWSPAGLLNSFDVSAAAQAGRLSEQTSVSGASSVQLETLVEDSGTGTRPRKSRLNLLTVFVW